MDYEDLVMGAKKDHFWFRAKRDLIHILLSKSLTTQTNKILDVGAGTGEDIDVLRKFGSVYAIDVDQRSLDMISDSMVAEKKIADACNIPYADNTFDVVVAFDVLEHVKDDAKMVSEIQRVLKPGGKFIFTVPAFNFLYSEHDRKLKHFRRYSKSNIKNILKKLKRVKLGYWFFMLFIPAALTRLLSKYRATQCVPGFFNFVCFKIFCFENWLLSKGVPFPCGLSIFGIYEKKL